MPSQFIQLEIADLLTLYRELDVKRVTRPELGPLGTPALEKVIAQFISELSTIESYWEQASEARIRGALRAYKGYLDVLYAFQSAGATAYPAVKQEQGEKLRENWDQTREVWSYFAAIAYSLSELFLGPDAVVKKMRDESQATVERIRREGEEIIRKAEQQAQIIEEKVRFSAQGISIQVAQDEFQSASNSLRHKSVGWGLASATAIAAFIIVGLEFYFHLPRLTSIENAPVALQIAEAGYMAAMRLVILTAVGTSAAFCLRMFRAHLHMSEVNLHRRRVANSMSAFVESATSSEQRDLILTKLIEAVVAFGESGILSKESDTPSATAIAIEAAGKSLGSK